MGFLEKKKKIKEIREEEGVVQCAKPLPGQTPWGPGSSDLATERLVTLARAILEQRWG